MASIGNIVQFDQTFYWPALLQKAQNNLHFPIIFAICHEALFDTLLPPSQNICPK